MSCNVIGGTWTLECLQNQRVYHSHSIWTIKHYSKLSVLVVGIHNPSSTVLSMVSLDNTSDPSKIAYLISSLPPNNRFPNFFIRVHCPISCQGLQCGRYCLTEGLGPFPQKTSDSYLLSSEEIPDCWMRALV